MENLVWLVAGFVLGALLTFLRGILDADPSARETRIRILKDGHGNIRLEPKSVDLRFAEGRGQHAFVSELQDGESVTVRFRPKFLLRKFESVKGPFPPSKDGERGVFVLEGGQSLALNPDIEPDRLTDYWRFTVEHQGKELDPGIRIRK